MNLKSIFITLVTLLLVFFFITLFTVSSRPRLLLFTPFKITTEKFYPPTNIKLAKSKNGKVKLIVFLHGIGCNENSIEWPFSTGGLYLDDLKEAYRQNLAFLSIGYEMYSPSSLKSIEDDVLKKIKKYSDKYDAKEILLIGISHGGTLALNVLRRADKNLQDQITELISVFPIVDYEYTLKNTKIQSISDTLKDHFSMYSNPYNEMRLESPIKNIFEFPYNTKIVLIEGKKDTNVPPKPIEDFYTQLKNLNKNVQLIAFDVDHDLSSVEKEYRDLLVESILR